MKRKVMIPALIFLLFLPAMGFTGDVEVSSCYPKWTRKGMDTYVWEVEITVRNPTDKDYRVSGRFAFYNLRGHIIYGGRFSGKVEAGERTTFVKKGEVPARYHESTGHCEATITRAHPTKW